MEVRWMSFFSSGGRRVSFLKLRSKETVEGSILLECSFPMEEKVNGYPCLKVVEVTRKFLAEDE